ncbi:MAG: hypothetical protein IT384_10900 [Deltaproteobacteria bacterium]|nr:hypothetical protein [Deltaproteobacteria bacterium]
MTNRWLLAAALGLAACSSTAEPGADAEIKRCFFGDPAMPVEIEPIFRTVSGQIEPLADRGRVPLILPPQGGKVAIVGVRAKNLDTCPVNLATALRDTCSGAVIALEQRPILLEPGSDGWASPIQPAEITNYSNLPACPRANLDRSIHEEPYELSIEVTDKDLRTARTVLQIVPFCGEPENELRCQCECTKGYKLGDACEVGFDAGVIAPTCRDGG